MDLRKTHNEIVRLQAELDEINGLRYEGGELGLSASADPRALEGRIVCLKRLLPVHDAYRRYGSVAVA